MQLSEHWDVKHFGALYSENFRYSQWVYSIVERIFLSSILPKCYVQICAIFSNFVLCCNQLH